MVYKAFIPSVNFIFLPSLYDLPKYSIGTSFILIFFKPILVVISGQKLKSSSCNLTE